MGNTNATVLDLCLDEAERTARDLTMYADDLRDLRERAGDRGEAITKATGRLGALLDHLQAWGPAEYSKRVGALRKLLKEAIENLGD